MRKNGSRLISFKQYRITDLLLFALILTIFDMIAHFAPIALKQGADYTFVLTVPIVLLIMIRWGWQSALFAVGDGLLLSALNNTGVWQSYVSYAVGNSFILLLLVAVRFIGKEKITGKWFFSVVFVISGWILQILGVTLMMWITTGGDFLGYLAANAGFGATGLISLAVGIALFLVLRRLDGMVEDQKHYLLRLDAERKEAMRRDEFGDEPIELDEESISIIKRDENDFHK